MRYPLLFMKTVDPTISLHHLISTNSIYHQTKLKSCAVNQI